jgi:hypothetical protein
VSPDPSVRRSAQDDGFVGGPEYNWLNMQEHEKIAKVTGSEDDDFVGFQKLQGEVISLRSSTQLENILSLRLQPANRSDLILFSDALLKAVNNTSSTCPLFL